MLGGHKLSFGQADAVLSRGGPPKLERALHQARGEHLSAVLLIHGGRDECMEVAVANVAKDTALQAELREQILRIAHHLRHV